MEIRLVTILNTIGIAATSLIGSICSSASSRLWTRPLISENSKTISRRPPDRMMSASMALCHAARSVVLDQYGNDQEARPPCPRRGYRDAWRGYRFVAWAGQNMLAARRSRGSRKNNALHCRPDRSRQSYRARFCYVEAAISAASTNDWLAVQAAVRWGSTPRSGVRRLAQSALGARRRRLENRVRQLAQRTPKCAPRRFPAAVRRLPAGYRTTCGTTAGRGRHWRCRAPG
jgi:hypothetical protein